MASTFPLVSVIIPSYNHGQYLEQRIESVLKQTYSKYELIILDDNSTDGSLEFINKYKKHPNVKAIIVNDENSGSVFKQWAKGVNLAEGKYLWIAESDDYADKNFLKETVQLAEDNQRSGLVFTDSFNIDQDGIVKEKISARHRLLRDIDDKHFIFSDPKKTPDYFIEDMLILNVSAVLFNARKFMETVSIPELKTFKNTGDQFAYISIFMKYDILYLSKALNYRRTHGENTTTTNFQNGIIYKERIRIINNFFPLLGKFRSSSKSFNNYLKQNFIKAIDFGMYKEMEELLGKFRGSGFLTFQKYLYLKIYILLAKKLKGKIPYKFRLRIKKILEI